MLGIQFHFNQRRARDDALDAHQFHAVQVRIPLRERIDAEWNLWRQRFGLRLLRTGGLVRPTQFFVASRRLSMRPSASVRYRNASRPRRNCIRAMRISISRDVSSDDAAFAGRSLLVVRGAREWRESRR